MRLNALRHLAVIFELFLFIRQGAAVEIETFRPIKSNALRAVLQDCRHFLRQLDVGRKDDVPTVAGGGFGFAQLGQALGDLILAGLELAGFSRRWGWTLWGCCCRAWTDTVS